MVPRQSLRRDGCCVELRPYDLSCAPELYRAAIESRKEIRPWMPWLSADYSLRDSEDWIAHAEKAWKAQREYEFVIYDRENGALLGGCGINNINRQNRFANVGYWVRTSGTRLGTATQAARLMKEFGLNILGFNRLEIVVAEGNAASRRVAEKAGAFYEGKQRRRVQVAERVYDAHMYSFV